MSTAKTIRAQPVSGIDDQVSLQHLRAQIDEIDQRLVTLLAERTTIIDTVSQQKVQSGIVFRPRREQQKHALLRQMAAQHDLALDMVFALWRVLMTQASYRQRPFTLCLGGAALISLVQQYFVAFADTEPTYRLSIGNHKAIDDQQADADNRMGVIGYQNGDWPGVLIDSTARITTALPWYGQKSTPEAYVVADAPWDLEADAEWVLWCPEPLVTSHSPIYPPLSCTDGHGTDGYLSHCLDSDCHDSEQAMLTAFDARFGDRAKLLGRIPRPAPLASV